VTTQALRQFALLIALAIGSAVAGIASASPGASGAVSPTAETTTSPVAARPTPLPPFRASTSLVTAASLGKTWRLGCPIGPSALRLLRVRYVGFDGTAHLGSIVVATSVVSTVQKIFAVLYARRFPIRQMKPESAFGGSDPASMAADNTSGFNCRRAVASGPPQWSVHALGEAIDVNPVENPYLFDGTAQPARGARFLDRGDVRPGMAVPGGTLVAAFTSAGWFWGGRWASSPDYQHFSATGG